MGGGVKERQPYPKTQVYYNEDQNGNTTAHAASLISFRAYLGDRQCRNEFTLHNKYYIFIWTRSNYGAKFSTLKREHWLMQHLPWFDTPRTSVLILEIKAGEPSTCVSCSVTAHDRDGQSCSAGDSFLSRFISVSHFHFYSFSVFYSNLWPFSWNILYAVKLITVLWTPLIL